MLTEEDFRKIIRDQEEGRRQYESRMREPIDVRLKIMLEGFKADETELDIPPDIQIYRATFEEREAFFKKAQDMDMTRYNAENNEFFLTFDFPITKGEIQSLTPGNKLTQIAIFFAVCSKAFIQIDKGQFFLSQKSAYVSAGLIKTPQRSLKYERNVHFDKGDIEKMGTFWPLYNDLYTNAKHFALIARRFYYSLTRYQWDDELIDLIIALEALLVPENVEGKGGVIAKRLSKLLSKEFPAGTVHKNAQKCYDLRNKVVHGDVVTPLENDARASVEDLSVCVKCALQKYLLTYNSLSPVDLVKEIDKIELKKNI